MVVLGGRDDGGAMGDVWVLDLTTGTWSQMAASILARYGAGMAVQDGRVFVAGGSGIFDESLGSLEIVDVDGGTVDTRPYAFPLSAHPSVFLDDHGDGLFFAGGRDDGGQWWSDYWHFDLGHDVQATWLYDFAKAGLVPTEGFTVLADAEHGVAWGVPGHSFGADAAGVWVLEDDVVKLSPAASGSDVLRTVSLAGLTNPRRVTSHPGRRPSRDATPSRPGPRRRGLER